MQEVACIDDSDCTQLGHKFVCHLYKCINWVEQTPCSLSSPCHQQEEQEEECQRVSNLYEDQTEICLPRRRPCSAHSDCGDERERCCRDSCCPTQFYRAWTQFRSDLVSLSLLSPKLVQPSVEDCSEEPAILCRAPRIQSPSRLQCTERSGYRSPYDTKNQRGASKVPTLCPSWFFMA